MYKKASMTIPAHWLWPLDRILVVIGASPHRRKKRTHGEGARC